MQYLFLEKDVLALRKKLDELEKERLNVARDASVHVGQSSESWHDNAGHELAVREQMSMAKKAFEMRDLIGKAKIVEPTSTISKVDIGSRIILEDIDTNQTQNFIISSYQVLDRKDKEEISYAAPIIEPFIGKRKGAKKKIETPSGEKTFKLIEIQTSNI